MKKKQKIKKNSILFVLFLLLLFVALFAVFNYSEISGIFINDEKNYLDSCSNCSIILITIDALRADHLTVYGYYRNTSPEIEVLSKEAYVFDNAISQYPFTVTALFSIFTGKYSPDFAQSMDLYGTLNTLPQILKENGFLNIALTSQPLVDRKSAFSGSFDKFHDIHDLPSISNDILKPNASTIVKKASDVLSENKGEKIFLWIHLFEPHTKYKPTEKHKYTFSSKNFTEQVINEDLYDGYGGIPKIAVVDNRSDKEYYLDRYDEELLSVDEEIGNLIDYLKKEGMYDSTLLIICGLQGESLGEHEYYFMHGTNLNEENIKSALIVKPPKKTSEERINGLFSIQEIFSMVSSFIDASNSRYYFPEEKKELFMENIRVKIDNYEKYEKNFPKYYGIRYQNEKLIYNNNSKEYAFYNLKDDKLEHANLNDNPLFSLLITNKKNHLQKRIKEIESYKEEMLKEADIFNGEPIYPELQNDFFSNFRFEKKILNNRTSLLIGNYQNMTLKIRVDSKMTEKDSRREFEYYKEMVLSLYDERASSYPGVVSNRVKCEGEFNPRKVENKSLEFYELYATNNLGYGACVSDLIAYKAILYSFYCETKGDSYIIELFFPKDLDFKEYIDQLDPTICALWTY